MYIVTGGAGFIGSAFIWQLNQRGISNILVVDNLGSTEKWKNLVNLKYEHYLHKDQFIRLAVEDKINFPVEAIIHMGACSSTTELNADYLMENNYRYSRILAEYALAKGARFIYASSAATYGDGEFGFSDGEETMLKLKPMNMYGYSKQLFDIWAYRLGLDKRMVGLKFFNVFGPNEYHKGDMKSVLCKAYHQVRRSGQVSLFRSYKPEYPHGGQKRDFVYIKDCCQVIDWFLRNPDKNGVFNVGTGEARSWKELASAIFAAMGQPEKINFIDMPESIRDKYQYFTQADMGKLRATGYDAPFTSLEEAAKDYVCNYLAQKDSYL